jgi:hypothetical protein
MHHLSKMHCSSCLHSCPIEGCRQRHDGCRRCMEARHLFGSIEVDVHECPSCGGTAGYALLHPSAQGNLQSYSNLSFGFSKSGTIPNQDRIHLFSRWLSNQIWWIHNREHIEAVLNTLTHQGDPAGFTQFLEYLWSVSTI